MMLAAIQEQTFSKMIQQKNIAIWKLTATTAVLIKLTHPPLPGIHSGLGQILLNQTLPTTNILAH